MPLAIFNDMPFIADSMEKIEGGWRATGATISLNFTQPARLFYRHGWQSWSLAAWFNPAKPPIQISSSLLGAKDEDPEYIHSTKHVSAWIGAVELDDGSNLLMGSLSR